MARTKICFVVDSAYAGGAERYVALIAHGLDRGRFEVSVLAADAPGLDAWCGALEVPVARSPMGLPFRPWHALPIARALSGAKPDIVHVNVPGPYDGQMGLVAPIARLVGAANVVVTEHLPMVEWLWKRAALKRLSSGCVDRVLTICRANVPFLVERQRVPEHKITVVYNGVGEERVDRRAARERIGLHEGEVAMVFLGSLIERKGLGVLLDAVSGLATPGWKLIIVGSGNDGPRFEARARALECAERIAFLGQLESGAVDEVLSAADMLVLPSFMEGMPYVILEAMAHSLPVIATRINGIPEAVSDGESGLLVAPGDAEGLRAAFEELLPDGTVRERMGRAGRARYEEFFTLERHLAAMDSFYVGLMDPK